MAHEVENHVFESIEYVAARDYDEMLRKNDALEVALQTVIDKYADAISSGLFVTHRRSSTRE